MEDLVGIREAARRIGISHSTISRQIRAGQIPLHGTDGRPLVSVAEVQRARAKSVNPAKSGNWAGLFAGEVDMGSAGRPAATAGALPPLDLPYGAPDEDDDDKGSDGPSLNDVRKADLSIQFRLRQLQLKEREGELVSVAAARLQQQEMARRVRDAVLALPESVAEELASMSDPGAIEERLEAEIRQILEGLSASMESDAGEIDHDA